jgi:hypothetical protein
MGRTLIGRERAKAVPRHFLEFGGQLLEEPFQPFKSLLMVVEGA